MSKKTTTTVAAKDLALKCREVADAKKAENIVIMDISEVSTIADYFVIASATSTPHLKAVADEIRDRVKAQTGVGANAVEGAVNAEWTVLDYFDVIVHVMREDVRERFDLEGLWGDAPRIDG